MRLQEIYLYVQAFRKFSEVLHTLEVSNTFLVIITINVIEDDGSNFGEVVVRDVLIEDGKVGEWSEEFRPFELIELMIKFVVDWI